MAEDFLTFPDAPRVELDRLLDELVDRAREVLTTQGRLRALLRANQAVVEHLELPVVLRRIVEVAVELVDAHYGALGVIAPHGGLEQFIHVGMPPMAEELIGHLPEGHGLLGALIDDPRPIRLEHISADPRSAGFPPHHPSMDSFLGVPVRVRDEVYGNLYLSNPSSGSFTAEDEQLVISLAATAGLAIDNARLFAQTKRQELWSAASAEITAVLLDADQDDSIGILADKILQLADADLVCVMLPTEDPTRLIVDTARGTAADSLPGTVIPLAGSISGSVVEGKQPRLTEDAGNEFALHDVVAIGPAMAVPLRAADRTHGAMVVGRTRGRSRFTAADLEMAADFAAQASVAMELARGRSARERMSLLEDRNRIARDLHDHVIQQLFATGLELQSVLSDPPPGSAAGRITHSVATLDTAIAQIRTAIFALSASGDGPAKALRHRIIDVMNELAPGLSRTPTVRFSGAVDLMATGELADDVVAVTREALANVVKHAAAQNTSISVAAVDGTIAVEVTDDGQGAAPIGPLSGLANLKERAHRRGGTFTFESGGGATRVRWRVPVERPGSDDGEPG